jgi:hypothetical protein
MEANFYMPTEEDFKLTQDEIWNDISKRLSEAEDISRREAIEMLFRKDHLQDDFMVLSWPLRIFYWVKTFLCLGFCFTRVHRWEKKNILMVCWNDRRTLEMVSWDCCWVECGIFSNWYVYVGTDGN